MRFISADYIFPISSPPVPNGVIEIDNKGEIIAHHASKLVIDEALRPSIEYYKGIICPGFVNTHCHLELSHLKGIIGEGYGLPFFIKEIISKRNQFANPTAIAEAIADAEQEMIRNGIVAVGDISNTTDTLAQKAKGNLIYSTFIELFDLYNATKTQPLFDAGKALKQQFIKAQQQLAHARTSLVPHASYSVSPELFKLINAESSKADVLSIHNQETPSEDELFKSKSGVLLQTLSQLGVAMDTFADTGKSAIKSVLQHIFKCNKLLLVHNTYATDSDINWAIAYHKNNQHSTQLYWVTCPNANLYIENKLPDYTAFIANQAKVTIGTDSYASNWSLNILDELKTIAKHFPDIDLQTLLTWATKNGAEALSLENRLGTIEKGKNPGLNLISTSHQLKLTTSSTVTKLI